MCLFTPWRASLHNMEDLIQIKARTEKEKPNELRKSNQANPISIEQDPSGRRTRGSDRAWVGERLKWKGWGVNEGMVKSEFEGV